MLKTSGFSTFRYYKSSFNRGYKINISKLIENLQYTLDTYGDIEVKIYDTKSHKVIGDPQEFAVEYDKDKIATIFIDVKLYFHVDPNTK